MCVCVCVCVRNIMKINILKNIFVATDIVFI